MPAKPARKRGKKPAISRPPSSWVAGLQEWKLEALTRVLQQMEHICSGPGARPKSFCVTEAVHNVVARDHDPESQLGLHLQHLLTGAIAHQITRRTELLPELQVRAANSPPPSQEFMLSYLNSRWWVENFCGLDSVRCQDVKQAVGAAVAETIAEQMET